MYNMAIEKIGVNYWALFAHPIQHAIVVISIFFG